MSRVVHKCLDKTAGEALAAKVLLTWSREKPEDAALGGATGGSPVGVWKRVWQELSDDPEAHQKLIGRRIAFLDEYLGAFPSYHHWGWRNLRVDHGGFLRGNVFVPRGCFFEDGRMVTSVRLDQILAEAAGEWEALTEPGVDGEKPEVRIKGTATHPVLCEIRDSMAAYDRLVRSLPGRLQILGIGVEGHIGFVERGAAARETSVMLVRLANSTREANKGDFSLRGPDGEEDVSVEPAHYAVTQGIGTVLAADGILMLAWGRKKQAAVTRMLCENPGPQNPAGWIQAHENVTVVCDTDAFGSLDPAALTERGWVVEDHA